MKWIEDKLDTQVPLRESQEYGYKNLSTTREHGAKGGSNEKKKKLRQDTGKVFLNNNTSWLQL